MLYDASFGIRDEIEGKRERHVVRVLLSECADLQSIDYFINGEIIHHLDIDQRRLTEWINAIHTELHRGESEAET